MIYVLELQRHERLLSYVTSDWISKITESVSKNIKYRVNAAQLTAATGLAELVGRAKHLRFDKLKIGFLNCFFAIHCWFMPYQSNARNETAGQRADQPYSRIPEFSLVGRKEDSRQANDCWSFLPSLVASWLNLGCSFVNWGSNHYPKPGLETKNFR